MIGVKINQSKSMFFDAPKVMRAVDAATRRVLSKFGAFVRTAARSSIRARKKSSAPGSPPSSHTGLLKRFIYFGYDASARSVVIGPALLRGKSSEKALPALEYGGASTTTVRRRGKRMTVASKVQARPFMRPALKKEIPKLPPMWRDSVKP